MRVSVIRRATRSALAAFVILGGAASASAQTVDEVVAKHIQARGGYDKIKAIQTIKMTRTVATPFTNVQLIVYKKRPNLLRFEQTPKGQTTSTARGINAETAWDTAAGGKIVPRPEKVAIEGRETDADFDGLLVDWKEKGHTVTLEGTEAYAGSQAYKLKVTTKGGSVRHVFIDTKSFMEIGMTGLSLLPQMDPKTKEFRTQQSSFVFSDFRDVNGVKFPFSIDEERIGGPITQSFATYTDKIEVNVPMEDALFATPSGSPPPGK
jgi:hypothetical protein